MKYNSKKRIGKIALGILFLLNPGINVIDILPDFIGCLLIVSGLRGLRDISDSFEEARLNFLRLFWISLSHIPAFVAMIMISSTYMSEKTSILVFAFIYSVIEFIILSNALSSLIDGFIYIGERHGGDCCFYLTKANGKKIEVGSLKSFTYAFLIITKALTVVPNLLYLYDTSLDYGAVVSPFAVNPIEFIGPVTAVCFIPALIVGIAWAIRMYSYIKDISRDTQFIENIDRVLSDKALTSTAEFKYRRIKTAFCFIVAAAVLSIDFYSDEFNVIPDIICAALLLIAVLFMKKNFELKGRLAVVLCSLYTFAEVLLFCIAVYFNMNFKFADVSRVPQADGIYILYVVAIALCEVLFVLSFGSILCMYTKALKGGFDIAQRNGHSKNGKDIFLTAQRKKNIIAFVLSAATGICHIVYIISMGNMIDVKIQQNAFTSSRVEYLPYLGGFWMVMLLVNIALAVFVYYSLLKTKEELKQRLYIL